MVICLHRKRLRISKFVRTLVTCQPKNPCFFNPAITVDPHTRKSHLIFKQTDDYILLQKMEKCGCRGPIQDMMKSYLSDRWQFVDMIVEETNQKRITRSVPQGSILGPFLFLLHINNLDSFSGNSKMSMFANDTTIFNTEKNVSFSMQPEIVLNSDWMTSNKLTIIVDKCEVMCFGSGNPPPLKIKDTPIQCKISCKYLGLHVDKRLRFNQHLEYLVKKLNKFCGLI